MRRGSRRKTLVVFILLLLTSVWFNQTILADKSIITVDDSGGADYTSIQDALNHAHPGDTIMVYNGTYHENILISIPVHLIGENSLNTIIDNTGTLVTITSNSVTMESFTIRNAGSYGIYLDTTHDVTIQNCNIYGTGSFAIYIKNSNHCTLRDTSSHNNHRYGSYIVQSQDCSLIHCTTYDNDNQYYHDHGFMFNGVSNITITDCISYNNYYGFYLDYSNNCTLTRCTAYNNAGYGIHLYNTDDTIMTDCRTHDNAGFGFFLERTDRCSIADAVCYRTNTGIMVYYSTNNSITDCTTYNNSWAGIQIRDNSDNNTVTACTTHHNREGIMLLASKNNLLYHNILYQNFEDGYDDGPNIWDDGYPSAGNYWGDYLGADTAHGLSQNIFGSDNIGDTPFVVNGSGNQDQYPLMVPWGFRLEGHCFYYNMQPVNAVEIEVLNTNTSEQLYAGTNNNWYALVLQPGPGINVGNILQITARDTNESVNITSHVMTQTELHSGFIHLDLILNVHYRDLKSFPFYYSQINTGAMVMKLMLDYLMWNSSINPNGPPSIYDEPTLYNRYRSTDNIINGNELVYCLNHEIDDRNYSWQYGYFFDSYANSSATEALRQICIWLDYPVNYYNNFRDVSVPKPGHPNHVPIAVPTSGDYTHWMVIRGIHTDRNAWLPPEQLTVYGFWINDPQLGGLSGNTYVTISRFLSTYFKPLNVPGDAYNGKYLAITDPPQGQTIPKTNTRVSIAEPKPTLTAEETKLVRNQKTNTNNIDKIMIESAYKAAWEVLKQDNTYADIFASAKPMNKPLYKPDSCTVTFTSSDTTFNVMITKLTGILQEIRITHTSISSDSTSSLQSIFNQP